MKNPLVKNAYKLLVTIVEDAKEDHNKSYSGKMLSELTGFSPNELNDAVSLLSANNLVDVFSALGTAPFNFHMVGPNTAGRYKYFEIKDQKETPIFISQSKDLASKHCLKDEITGKNAT